jgi:hypothetical protein
VANVAELNNWFVAEFYPLCDDTQEIFLDLDKLKKYGKFNPYDMVQIIDHDSVTISFDFITDCCLEFSGSAELHQDTLFLKYGFQSDSLMPCDCYCDYRMIYKIAKRDKDWMGIKIVKE